ncbi:MAG: hypothetical protein SGARI_008317 [Bacillariaceae sp.]
MQRHLMCSHLKVTNLTSIIEMLYEKWPDAPPHNVSTVFVPINREFLEKEGQVDTNSTDPSKVLNQLRNEGLWNSTVKVVEFGSRALQCSKYEERPSTSGAILNYFLAIQAEIFIGTEVSSYSHDLLATRFFRGNMKNYAYRPDGLHEWTPPGTVDPPGHQC